MRSKKLLINEEIDSYTWGKGWLGRPSLSSSSYCFIILERIASKVRHCEALLQEMMLSKPSTEEEAINVSVGSFDEAEPIPTATRADDIPPSPPQPQQHLRHRQQRAKGEWHVSPDPNGQARLRRKEHEELTLELVHMARRLKQNNVALRELVQQDKQTVDEADLALSVNAGRFKQQHQSLQQFTKKSWATTWRLIIMTFFVVVSIVLFFMLILVTRSR